MNVSERLRSEKKKGNPVTLLNVNRTESRGLFLLYKRVQVKLCVLRFYDESDACSSL